MSATTTLVDRISRAYPNLSDKLQQAADFAVQNPIEIATRSLRSVASTSGVSPATYSRLARALGYADYEQMREGGRKTMDHRLSSFSERARAIRTEGFPAGTRGILESQAAACMANIDVLVRDIDEEKLDAVVSLLHHARRVLLVGSLGSSGFADYFSYLAHWFREDWHVAGRNGTTLAASLSPMGEADAVLVVSKAPNARRSVAAMKAAFDKGVPTILITDSHSSPALPFADHYFIVATDSPHFFSSYAATLVLVETIITLVLKKSGPEAEGRIRETENQIQSLGESWVDE